MNKHSIKFRIIALCTMLMVVGFLSRIFFVLPYTKEKVTQLIATQQLSIASYIAGEVDQKIVERQSTLERIASNLPRGLMGSTKELRSWLTSIQQVNPLFRSGLLVLTTQGGLVAGSIDGGMADSLLQGAGPHWIERILQTSNAIVGSPFRDESRRAAILFGTAIRDRTGKAIGILVGASHLDAPGFLYGLSTQKWSNSGSFLIISPQDNIFVAATDPAMMLRPLPKPGINPLHDRAMNGYRGTGETVNAKGEREFSAIQSIPSAGWFTVVRIPLTEALAPINAMIHYALSTGSILAVGLLLALILLLPRILRKLDNTTAAMRDMANGRRPLERLPEDSRDEVGVLVRQFNLLVDRLKKQEAELRLSEARMGHMASHDGLTGLYNRMALINRLQQALDDAQRGHDGLALLFCDLDGFKPVNDTHGHDVGDRLLCAIAQRLQNGRRKTDTIARLGGDEFVIVLTHLQDPRSEGATIAQDYIDALGEPYGINGIDLSVSVSIGVSVYEGQATTVSKLISQADTAMYEAKRLGKNKYCLYD